MRLKYYRDIREKNMKEIFLRNICKIFSYEEKVGKNLNIKSKCKI